MSHMEAKSIEKLVPSAEITLILEMSESIESYTQDSWPNQMLKEKDMDLNFEYNTSTVTS